jgi:hypothetical protein
MTLLFALLNSGGSSITDEGSFHAPYYIAGGILFVLFGAMVALLAFGKGREHS